MPYGLGRLPFRNQVDQDLVAGAVEHEGTERSKHAHHQENEDPG